MEVTNRPTENWPCETPMAVSAITAPRPAAMIAAWPVLSTDSEICDWIEALENFSIETS